MSQVIRIHLLVIESKNCPTLCDLQYWSGHTTLHSIVGDPGENLGMGLTSECSGSYGEGTDHVLKFGIKVKSLTFLEN